MDISSWLVSSAVEKQTVSLWLRRFWATLSTTQGQALQCSAWDIELMGRMRSLCALLVTLEPEGLAYLRGCRSRKYHKRRLERIHCGPEGLGNCRKRSIELKKSQGCTAVWESQSPARTAPSSLLRHRARRPDLEMC